MSRCVIRSDLAQASGQADVERVAPVAFVDQDDALSIGMGQAAQGQPTQGHRQGIDQAVDGPGAGLEAHAQLGSGAVALRDTSLALRRLSGECCHPMPVGRARTDMGDDGGRRAADDGLHCSRCALRRWRQCRAARSFRPLAVRALVNPTPQVLQAQAQCEVLHARAGGPHPGTRPAHGRSGRALMAGSIATWCNGPRMLAAQLLSRTPLICVRTEVMPTALARAMSLGCKPSESNSSTVDSAGVSPCARTNHCTEMRSQSRLRPNTRAVSGALPSIGHRSGSAPPRPARPLCRA